MSSYIGRVIGFVGFVFITGVIFFMFSLVLSVVVIGAGYGLLNHRSRINGC